MCLIGREAQIASAAVYPAVPIAMASEGTRIEITSPDGPMTATVTPLPFLDPKKEIPATS